MPSFNTFECISSSYHGGDSQGWVSGFLDIESSKVERLVESIFLDMGDLKNVIENTNRLNLPIVLNPSECTFLDVGLWLHKNERLSVSTIEKHLRYLRFMENYVSAPVDFQHPSYENFRKHMDYREEIEGASPYALKHEWKAMQKYLKACGLQEWPYKPPSQPKHSSRDLPFPYTVRKFFYYEYSDDDYETALFQYLFFQTFMVGWRVPSEIIELKTSDVHIDSQGSGSITITEPKKHFSTRTIYPEHFILSSRSHKSLKNYLDHWRPKVENSKSDDSLFLQSSGKPFTVRYLGKKLSQYGKLIKPDFRPYDMRHWCAVARLIETKLKNGSFDKFQIQSWLGHENPRKTEGYIGSALQCFEQYSKSWIHGALRAPYQRGKHHINENRDTGHNKSLSGSSPVKGFRTGRAH